MSAPAGLVAHYTFDADDANDSSGNGNNGAVGGSVAFSTDTPLGSGKAMQTTDRGSAYVVTVPTSTSLQAISHQLTFSFWMKAGTAGQQNWFRIFQHANEGSTTQGWLIDRYSNSNETNIRVDTTGAGGQFNQNLAEGVNTTVLNNQWHHLVYTLNSGVWEEYLDGVPASGPYSHGNGFSNTRPLYLAGRNGAAEYIGLLDDVAVWDALLSQGKARSIYTVPNSLGLDYNVDKMSTLFDVFDTATPARIGPLTWVRQAGLTGHTTGDAWELDGVYYVQLDSDGVGVIGRVPEPSTFLLVAMGLLGLAACARRKKCEVDSG